MQNDAESRLAGPKKMAESMTIALRIRPPTIEEMKKNFARIVTTVGIDRDTSSSSLASSLKDQAEHKVIVMNPQMINEIGVDTLIQAGRVTKIRLFPVISLVFFDSITVFGLH